MKPSPRAANPSASYKMADLLMEGRLAERLAAHRGAGMSYEQIGRRLYSEAGIDVTSNTIRKWLRFLGIEADPKAAAS